MRRGASSSGFDRLLVLRFRARRHDEDYCHTTQVGIVNAVEVVVSDKSFKIIDVPLTSF